MVRLWGLDGSKKCTGKKHSVKVREVNQRPVLCVHDR